MTESSGLACLALMLRFHGIAVDGERLAHGSGGRQVGVPELVRGARDHGLKAQARTVAGKKLGGLVLPAIVRRRDGHFQILAKVVEGDVLVHDALSGQPRTMARKDFLAEWDGTIVLMARRASLSDLARRFDLGWFLQAMHKYRRLLGEVLAGLLLPPGLRADLATVLPGRHRQGARPSRHQHVGRPRGRARHRRRSTFESVLATPAHATSSPTPPTASTSSSARVSSSHLMALPIGYFEAQADGRFSVARVRELENIRNFLTSSALTLLVDFLFTFVYSLR